MSGRLSAAGSEFVPIAQPTVTGGRATRYDRALARFAITAQRKRTMRHGSFSRLLLGGAALCAMVLTAAAQPVGPPGGPGGSGGPGGPGGFFPPGGPGGPFPPPPDFGQLIVPSISCATPRWCVGVSSDGGLYYGDPGAASGADVFRKRGDLWTGGRRTFVLRCSESGWCVGLDGEGHVYTGSDRPGPDLFKRRS
jgi:hypothetical protein